ncbi:MAG: hypothetical protein UY50_C0025G0041 [Parcubacteria group bacterium GW2011_GWA2_49_9]|nr:MAG: hypothetical protein UY50_C0025G0041 [Parcubacteria group bacterium GW2011_GWA2_49_9]
MKIIYSTNPKREATDALARIFKEYKDIPVLFLSSGGSALSLLDPSILPENVNLTVSVLDEHYVADPNERNFEKLKKTEFFRVATKQPPSSQIRTPPVYDYFTLLRGIDPYGGTVEEAGKRFDLVLKNWMSENPDGKIVCTVGMGADGHTAGIVPLSDAALFEKLFNSPETLAVGYKTNYGPFPERVTSTFSLLKVVSDVILYASGEEKRKIIEAFLGKKQPLNEFPALFLKTLPQLTFFTDSV